MRLLSPAHCTQGVLLSSRGSDCGWRWSVDGGLLPLRAMKPISERRRTGERSSSEAGPCLLGCRRCGPSLPGFGEDAMALSPTLPHKQQQEGRLEAGLEQGPGRQCMATW